MDARQPLPRRGTLRARDRRYADLRMAGSIHQRPGPAGRQRRWLRVVTEQPAWSRGDSWTGNLDASVITDLPKPRVLDVCEWRENPHRHVRAEVMTRMPGRPCSPSTTPPSDLTLPESWWSQLSHALDDVQRVRTSRSNADQVSVDHRLRSVFGDDVNVVIQHWETVHGDLHWGNLSRDPFGVVDWELWGTGPAGTDASTLYLYSLGSPAVAETVHARFAALHD